MSSLGASEMEAGFWFEEMPLSRDHWIAGLVIFVTFVIEAWEMLILILSIDSIRTEFSLSIVQTGGLISAMFMGMIPGALLWGYLSNRIGRRNSLALSIGGYAVFPLISMIVPSYEALWIVRFIGGVVLSGGLVVSFPLFMESLPVAIRGRATVLLSAGWPVGTLVAVAIVALSGDLGWRTTLGLSAVSGLWAIAILRGVSESAYWLASKGRGEEAAEVVHRLSGKRLSPANIAKPSDQDEQMSMTGIFKQGVMRLTILSTLINFCFSWGYWGMTSWLPELLSQRGLSQDEGLGFIALSALFMFPGYLAASYLTGKFGRKRVMTSFVAIAAVAGISFSLSDNLTQLYFWNFALSFFSLGAWGVWNTWLGEIYSTENRGPGTAWGVMLQRVANTIAPIAIGLVLAATGFMPTVLFISAFLVATVLAAMLLPETEGVRLT